MRVRTFKECIKVMKKMTLLPGEGIVEIKNMDGKNIPLQPWPCRFFVSAVMIDRDQFEFTKLTFINLTRVIIQNFITMNYHRFMLILYWIGFLEVPEACAMSFSWFRWDFWNVRRGRKLGKAVSKRMIEKQQRKNDDFMKEIKKMNHKMKFEDRKS